MDCADTTTRRPPCLG